MNSYNLPPGVTMDDRVETREQVCVNGHIWYADMVCELGAWYFVSQDDDACSECGELSDV